MALTLTEAAKYSNNILQVGVIEKIVKDDPILERLQFKEIVGNGLTYNVETTESTANFYSVNEEIVESTSTVTQATATTKILIGDADVDRYLQTTRSNQQDLMSEQIDAKTKAIRKKFLETFWYGYAAGNTKEFDGLQTLISDATYNSVALGTDNTTPVLLNLSKLEEVVDLVKGGKPELIVMAKAMRRAINVFLNGVGGLTKEAIQGKTVQTLFDIPIAVSDYISVAENCDKVFGSTYGYQHTTPSATSDVSTTIFVLRFAPEAVCGIQSGGTIQVERLGSLETKDAERVRIKWYPAVMLQKIITVGKLTGVLYTGTVAA